MVVTKHNCYLDDNSLEQQPIILSVHIQLTKYTDAWCAIHLGITDQIHDIRNMFVFILSFAITSACLRMQTDRQTFFLACTDA